MHDTLQKKLEAIEDSKNTLWQEIRKAFVELGLLRFDHWKLSDRVKNKEEELNDLGTLHRVHQTQLAHLTDRVQQLEHRAEDAKRSRRNKVRIIGLLEGDEGADMVAVLESWIKSLLGKQQCTSFFALERVHRVNMFPDYMSAVQAKRASYMEVKRSLRTEELCYAQYFPRN
ncbi:hypothetical protein NDU88_007236 [Pleurodeles waltl]|uniref:Uncharacterized protein n=1 Tax=Pleurodeles waltl TaxID=8319 RepID=A0AAV7WEV2_PLEWA|nr:hypothetical protein NDU88_007236 [Pleurodeles waltl]